jgi:glycerate-2-kinase
MVLTTLLEGESREAGTFLASIAKEVAVNQRPMVPPCVLVAGGETTTTITGPAGLGGPSQELALGFAMEISGKKGICLATIDTDGTDGSSDFAGGIVDGLTVGRTRVLGLDVYERLRAHDSATLLMALGDGIITGNTGTNVCDVNVVYIAQRET